MPHCATLDGVEEVESTTAFGGELSRRRRRRGLSQRAAAIAAGFSPTRWNQLEKGYEERKGVRSTANPSRENAIGISIALKWPVDEVLEAAGLDTELSELELERLAEAGVSLAGSASHGTQTGPVNDVDFTSVVDRVLDRSASAEELQPLLDRLNPSQLSAIKQLLVTMLSDDDEDAPEPEAPSVSKQDLGPGPSEPKTKRRNRS